MNPTNSTKTNNKTVKNEIVAVSVQRRKERESTTQKKDLFLRAFILKACNISAACEAVDIDRTTFYFWMETDKWFSDKVQQCREALIDMAETQLIKAILAGDIKAITFFLERKGKSRGYGQTVEQDGDVHYYFHTVRPDEKLPR